MGPRIESARGRSKRLRALRLSGPISGETQGFGGEGLAVFVGAFDVVRTTTECDEFLAHFELRRVAPGTCGRERSIPAGMKTPESEVPYFSSTRTGCHASTRSTPT